MEKIFISNFLVYETPCEEAKGKFSAGLVVASRLNENNLLVESYNPNRDSKMTIKVGFSRSGKSLKRKKKPKSSDKNIPESIQ